MTFLYQPLDVYLDKPLKDNLWKDYMAEQDLTSTSVLCLFIFLGLEEVKKAQERCSHSMGH